MSKYKLYFKKPNVQMPPGEWKPWLPAKVLKHIKLVGVLLSVISVMIWLFLFRIMYSNGELIAWKIKLTADINNTIVRSIVNIAISLIGVLILLFIHEILHLLITIGKGDIYMYWNKSLLGVSPFSDCELNWKQSVIYKIMPFLVLTVGLYLVSVFIDGVVGGLFKYIAMINFCMSIGDLMLTPFMFRLPRNAVFYSGAL